MKPEELIQLLRTTNLGQIKRQLDKDYQEKSVRYEHIVSFILAAREFSS